MFLPISLLAALGCSQRPDRRTASNSCVTAAVTRAQTARSVVSLTPPSATWVVLTESPDREADPVRTPAIASEQGPTL